MHVTESWFTKEAAVGSFWSAPVTRLCVAVASSTRATKLCKLEPHRPVDSMTSGTTETVVGARFVQIDRLLVSVASAAVAAFFAEPRAR